MLCSMFPIKATVELCCTHIPQLMIHRAYATNLLAHQGV